MKTCGNCFHFFPEPIVDPALGNFSGCGEDMHVVTGVDPDTGCITSRRDVIASDLACEHWISEEAAKAAGWTNFWADQATVVCRDIRDDD
jgi:hypothetical protein